MEYTIGKLAQLAGVSPRTLRYYDEINLLKPAKVNGSGYRIYGQEEVDRLQQILFFRELDVDLETIVAIMNDPNFDKEQALQKHHSKLVEKRNRLDKLIVTVEKSIANLKGEYPMENKEKFAAFKENLIAENERKYGEEIRNKYGNKVVDASNAKLRGMSEDDYAAMQALEKELFDLIKQACPTGDPSSSLAQKAAEKHKEWLMYSWPEYSEEAHAGLAEMYVADERFKAYYDKVIDGGAEFLRDAILIFTGKKAI
ncbi:DNA-binding transcriptional MerR regulator [Scopulibacillus daqui]|uniref:DNA-binding transcriptional MerR regulator n=1 Tax=Scopulibacillus daqui TaxID=1469162 RepID=A0ABS2PVK6_9BACL|nr:MerR family transcriptional regulator [Scopulibacillus daqui]MBM7644082.1 DNA-binding transcriptional MerR regulator [Scopulibacillus daqui]